MFWIVNKKKTKKQQRSICSDADAFAILLLLMVKVAQMTEDQHEPNVSQQSVFLRSIHS